MRVEFDPKADAVYIYFSDEIPSPRVARTYPCDPVSVRGMINLDFDAAGRFVGIEVMDASKKLPKELLEDEKTIRL